MFRENDADMGCSYIRIPRNYPVYGKEVWGSMVGDVAKRNLAIPGLKIETWGTRRLT